MTALLGLWAALAGAVAWIAFQLRAFRSMWTLRARWYQARLYLRDAFGLPGDGHTTHEEIR